MPLTPGDVKAVKASIPLMFSETDSDVRGDILACIQRLVDRLRSVTLTLSRKMARSGKPQPPNALAKSLRMHRDLLTWLIKAATDGLRPAANYQTHFFSLKTLLIMAKSGIDPSIRRGYLSKQATSDVKWSFNVRLFNSALVSTLLDLLLDPFDDLRSFSAILLEMLVCPVSPVLCRQMVTMLNNGFMMSICDQQQQLPAFIDRAQKVMQISGRADHADGASRAFALVYAAFRDGNGSQHDPSSKGAPFDIHFVMLLVHYLTRELFSTIDACKRNIVNAINSSPMHGRLSSLRLIT